MACDVVKQFNPKVNLIAHFENIKSTKFSIKYFKQFNLVLNALDNLEARYHVNKMCVAASIPLFDSGTNGLNGQASIYYPPKTSCYACEPRATPKTYPVCTIRSIPDKIIHCILWSKEIFKLLFGDKNQSVLYEEIDSL